VCIYEGNDFIPSYNGTILELFFGDKADQFKEKVEDCCEELQTTIFKDNKVYKDYEDYLNKSVEKILKELSLDI
jgi:N12 class adenine-specific DNA methylase